MSETPEWTLKPGAEGKRHLNGHTKWVVGAFSAGILSVLAFLAVMDRGRIEDDANEALRRSLSNDKEIALVLRDVTDIKEHLHSIEDAQKRILVLLGED